MESPASDSAFDQRSVGGSGRLMRIFCSVATTRHPVQSSTFSVWNTVDTRSNNALLGRVSPPDPLEGSWESLQLGRPIAVSGVPCEDELITIALRRQRLGHVFVGDDPVVHVVAHEVRIE
jgi:hypothetical protein